MRECAGKEGNDFNWLVFDGPIDTMWIENLNAVLDDNKQLCLVSGERIKVGKQVRLFFEAGDLKTTSPATVSRCGVVHFEDKELGWKMYVQAWI